MAGVVKREDIREVGCHFVIEGLNLFFLVSGVWEINCGEAKVGEFLLLVFLVDFFWEDSSKRIDILSILLVFPVEIPPLKIFLAFLLCFH